MINFFTIYATKIHPKYKGLSVHSFTLNAPQPVHIVAILKTDIEKRNKLKNAHKLLTENGVIHAIIEKASK